MKLTCCASLITLLLAFAPALPQTGQTTVVSSRPTLGTHSPESLSVVLDAVLPQTASTLLPDDLIVLDNGQRIPSQQVRILPEHDATAPAQLLLVIDAVNSSIQDVSRSETAVAAFLRQGTGTLPQPTTILIVSATEPHSKDPGATPSTDTRALHQRQLFVHRIPTGTDGNRLAKCLDDYKAGLSRILDSQAGGAIAERVRLSLEALSYIATAEAGLPGAKVTVWLSPGWPFLASSEAKSSEQLFDSVVYFSDALRMARMILCMIDPQGVTNQDNSAKAEAFLMASRPASVQAAGHAPEVPAVLGQEYYKQFTQGVRASRQSNPNDLTLQVLAIQSGGTVTQQNNDTEGLIARCAADISKLTAITYMPQRATANTMFHEVQVRTVKPPQTLRTRTGFYTR